KQETAQIWSSLLILRYLCHWSSARRKRERGTNGNNGKFGINSKNSRLFRVLSHIFNLCASIHTVTQSLDRLSPRAAPESNRRTEQPLSETTQSQQRSSDRSQSHRTENL